MGTTKWNELTEPEQKQLLIKLKQKYKQLVSEGKQDEADQLLAVLKDNGMLILYYSNLSSSEYN